MEQLIYQAQPIGLIDFIKSIWFYFFMLVIFLVIINFIQNNLNKKINNRFIFLWIIVFIVFLISDIFSTIQYNHFIKLALKDKTILYKDKGYVKKYIFNRFYPTTKEIFKLNGKYYSIEHFDFKQILKNNLKIKIEYSFLDKYNPIIIRIWKLNNK